MYIYGSRRRRGSRQGKEAFIELHDIEIIHRKDWALSGNRDVRYSGCVGSKIENGRKPGEGKS